MITRHPRLSMFAIGLSVVIILYAIGIPAGWSNGALGWAMIGGGLVGPLAVIAAEERLRRRRPGP